MIPSHDDIWQKYCEDVEAIHEKYERGLIAIHEKSTAKLCEIHSEAEKSEFRFGIFLGFLIGTAFIVVILSVLR